MAVEFFTPGFCQIAGNAGAEFVIFDMEHGGVGIDVLKAQMLKACR
jgi:2-keto-3-deoxy-L-rhamnonate aldolase RhmA